MGIAIARTQSLYVPPSGLCLFFNLFPALVLGVFSKRHFRKNALRR
jgi:hypothetical protein